jgi:hypothetical protein
MRLMKRKVRACRVAFDREVIQAALSGQSHIFQRPINVATLEATQSFLSALTISDPSSVSYAALTEPALYAKILQSSGLEVPAIARNTGPTESSAGCLGRLGPRSCQVLMQMVPSSLDDVTLYSVMQKLH